MPKTLILNKNWDIHINESGDIATSTGSYAIAQNVANAVRLFTNDAYFDRDKGIPHYDVELGYTEAESQSALQNRIQEAALAVDGVTAAEVSLSFEGRTYGGEITITTEDGSNATIEL